MHRRDLLRLLGLSAIAGAAGGAHPFTALLGRQRTTVGGSVPDVELALTAAPGEVAILPGEPTRVWRFAARLIKGPADTLRALPGSYLGPVIRLRRGQSVRVRFSNQLADVVGMRGMMGGGEGVRNGAPLRVMTLRTRARKGAAYRLPERLSTFGPAWSARPAGTVRAVPLTFMRMQWLLGGRTFEMTGVAPEETVNAGSTHLWEFRNLANPMGMQAAHPMHIHGPQFRVVSRAGSPANALREGIVDAGWQDTVLVLPGETVLVQIPFTRHPGLYLYHCHILEHEDMGMMRNFRVT